MGQSRDADFFGEGVDLRPPWIVNVRMKHDVSWDEARFYGRANEDYLRCLCNAGILLQAFSDENHEYWMIFDKKFECTAAAIYNMPALAADIAYVKVRHIKFIGANCPVIGTID